MTDPEPKKRQSEPSPEALRLIQTGMRATIVELEQRIRWASEREVPSPGDSRLAEEQRRFWSGVKTDFEEIRATYVIALERLERAEAGMGLPPNILAISSRLSLSLRDHFSSSTGLVVRAWPANVRERTAEASLVVHAKAKGRWFADVFVRITEKMDGAYDVFAEASMQLYHWEVDLRSRRIEEVLGKYREKYGAKGAVGEPYDSLEGEPNYGAALGVVFPIASSTYDAKDFSTERVCEELAKSAAERLPEMERLCKELVGALSAQDAPLRPPERDASNSSNLFT